MPQARPADQVLNETFLQIRAQLIDVAAMLDRIDRADDSDQAWRDERLKGVQAALEVLREQSGNRAEQIQMIFSDEYTAGWNRA